VVVPDESKHGATARTVNHPDGVLLQELARKLPECDRAAKLRALLARVVDVDARADTQALTVAADELAASAVEALADDPWSAFEAAAANCDRACSPVRCPPAPEQSHACRALPDCLWSLRAVPARDVFAL